jgi:hypothetical protein
VDLDLQAVRENDGVDRFEGPVLLLDRFPQHSVRHRRDRCGGDIPAIELFEESWHIQYDERVTLCIQVFIHAGRVQGNKAVQMPIQHIQENKPIY